MAQLVQPSRSVCTKYPLFIIVMEALSRDNRTGLPWELLYADDLALMADNLQDLEVQYSAWKQGIESKGL